MERHRKGGLSLGQEIKMRSDLAANEAQKHRSLSPGADMGKPDVKALPDCGPEAAARSTGKAVLERHAAQKKQESPRSSTATSNQIEQGWIMTLALDGEDLGDHMEYVIRYLDAKTSKNRSSSSRSKYIRSIGSFMQDSMSFEDVINLYGVYNNIGESAGVEDVRGHDLVKTDVIPRFVRQKNVGQKQNIESGKFIKTAAWHIKMGAEDALDTISCAYGTVLLEGYVEDLLAIKQTPDLYSEDQRVCAVKRVNSAYASLLRVAEGDENHEQIVNDLVRLTLLLRNNDLDLAFQDVSVAAENQEEVFVGTWDINKKAYGKNYHPPLPMGVIGSGLRTRTSHMYESALSAYLLERNKLINPHDYIVDNSLPEAMTIGRCLQMTTYQKAGETYMQTLVFIPLKGKYAGQVVKYVAPQTVDGGEYESTLFLPGDENREISHFLSEYMGKSGFKVAKSAEGIKNVSVSEFAHGDSSLYTFHKKMRSQDRPEFEMNDLIIAAIELMTDEAEYRLLTGLELMLEKKGIDVVYDKVEKALTYFDWATYSQINYIADVAVDPQADTERKYDRLTNWRFDSIRFSQLMATLKESPPIEISELLRCIITFVKESSILIDPVNKISDVPKSRTSKEKVKKMRKGSYIPTFVNDETI